MRVIAIADDDSLIGVLPNTVTDLLISLSDVCCSTMKMSQGSSGQR